MGRMTVYAVGGCLAGEHNTTGGRARYGPGEEYGALDTSHSASYCCGGDGRGELGRGQLEQMGLQF